MNKKILFLAAFILLFLGSMTYAQLPPHALGALMLAIHNGKDHAFAEIDGKQYKLKRKSRKKMPTPKKLSDSESREMLSLDKRTWPYTEPFVVFRSELIDEDRDSGKKVYMVYPFIGIVRNQTSYDVHQDYMFKVIAKLVSTKRVNRS